MTTINLKGPDGNAWVIMGLVRNYLKGTGQSDRIEAVSADMTSSDYDHLLDVALEVCNGALKFSGRD